MQSIRLAFALIALCSATTGARTITLDHTTPTVVFDGLLDGFPGLYAKDGTADATGNPLSIVRKTDVTEVRAVMEFPLASVDITAAEVSSATLRFNIDDVLSTLGPGTELIGKSATTILVHSFDGDGLIKLSDYKNTDEPATAVNLPNAFTDASLNQSGAVFFNVDVSERLRQALAAGKPFMGILWRTTDSPTGTSIDDGRGGSASGEPSDTSAGSHMPQLIIEVAAPPNPVCGNGAVETGEQCDDANSATGDCCNAQCQRDADNTTCDDGNACTTNDVCTAGMCSGPGADGVCDDNNPCTNDDTCAAGVCAGTPAANPCDDGNVCTGSDACVDGACVGTPTTNACDDGNNCTTDDTCTGGTCVGQSGCGDGTVQAACSEECDDGNHTPADGCSATCRHDALTGGTGVKECLVAFALRAPTRTASGELASEERCVDGDACDSDPQDGVCGFDVAVCLGRADVRVPGCLTPAALAGAVAGFAKRELQASVSGVAPGTCGAPVRISVAVRGKRTLREGKKKLVASARGAAKQKDRDVLVLRCVPHS